ncbi:MAG: LVIVD repeat-containing protein [Candidatus Heimdallarchaeota archaeon]
MKKSRHLVHVAFILALFLIVSIVRCSASSGNQDFKCTELAQIDTGGDTFDVQVEGDIAYVIDMGSSVPPPGGLVIIDVSDPSHPSQIGHLFDGGIAHEIFVDGNLAYVADHGDGLEIINVSNPSQPVEIDHFDEGYEEIDGVYVVEDIAYVIVWLDELEITELIIIDVSNPFMPLKLGEYNNESLGSRLQVINDLAYVAGAQDGLKILNVSDPANIAELGRFSDGGFSFSVDVVGSYAYVADGSGGLEIIDVTDPVNPVKVGEYHDGGSVVDLHVIGELVYVADSQEGLEIIDVSDPSNPVELAHYDQEEHVRIFVADDIAYLATHGGGLKIIKIETTENTKSSEFDLVFLFIAFFGLLVWRKRRV